MSETFETNSREARGISGTTDPKPGPTNVIRVGAPSFSASDLQILGSSNGFTIVLGQPQPQVIEIDGNQTFAFAIEPQAIVHMSPQTAKDLSILLLEHLDEHEKLYGTLQTSLTRARSAE